MATVSSEVDGFASISQVYHTSNMLLGLGLGFRVGLGLALSMDIILQQNYVTLYRKSRVKTLFEAIQNSLKLLSQA